MYNSLVNKKLKLTISLIFALSAFLLVWVNTGAKTESGYTTCGGGGFISQRSLNAAAGPDGINAGGPCLGNSVTKTVGGRYADTNVLNGGLIAVAVLSLASLVIPLVKDRKLKRS